ncbi:MAG: recG [Cytophagaceae bacterium]|jgi:ATP-dependent DNA helicase RecG|nr:recG [Cytophagaceae bacterium]
MPEFLETRIEYLKGIGPQKAALLNTELGIFTYADLLEYYPFRHEDRSRIYKISEIREDMPYIQVSGRLSTFKVIGTGFKKRLTATIEDGSGRLELVWFQGINWVVKKLVPGVEYIAFGKPAAYGHQFNIAHPEMDVLSEASSNRGLVPVYPLTEKIKTKSIDSKAISKAIQLLLPQAAPHIRETLSDDVLEKYKLLRRKDAIQAIHFPARPQDLDRAMARLKFEELFFIQLKLLKQMGNRKEAARGQIFKGSDRLTEFYKSHLPFDLTNAQKKVIKEIYQDLCSGKQMNRLLQGDVGSGKTIVAFLCMLIGTDHQAQSCIMAPTEILAQQHYATISGWAELAGIRAVLLTGSTKKVARKPILEDLAEGRIDIIIGTHALLEDPVVFKNLGLCVIDEQHRFGVAQRAKLWMKNSRFAPHILVMTATPIPRTLAMTLYGDLDVSVIDELPVGRKPIQTVHQYDKDILKVYGFMRKQIQEGRQVYVVFPLIEESEKMDLKNLSDGFDSIENAFKEYSVSMVHGRLKNENKDYEMQRFIKNETQIMVATTVIEVGVNVPNASVMVIFNAERFGLSQLHQLRGRVGRGVDQSYCILMTDFKLSADARKRIDTMCSTNNGFEIADVDLSLRGPGDMAGTMQSGLPDLKLANLAQDSVILTHARQTAQDVLTEDPDLSLPKNKPMKDVLIRKHVEGFTWSKIS